MFKDTYAKIVRDLAARNAANAFNIEDLIPYEMQDEFSRVGTEIIETRDAVTITPNISAPIVNRSVPTPGLLYVSNIEALISPPLPKKETVAIIALLIGAYILYTQYTTSQSDTNLQPESEILKKKESIEQFKQNIVEYLSSPEVNDVSIPDIIITTSPIVSRPSPSQNTALLMSKTSPQRSNDAQDKSAEEQLVSKAIAWAKENPNSARKIFTPGWCNSAKRKISECKMPEWRPEFLKRSNKK